jgi:hypothetical protein
MILGGETKEDIKETIVLWRWPEKQNENVKVTTNIKTKFLPY